MLSSANGRHRRPRQTPAAVVTVAATGAGIALPLLGTGAGTAHAADNSTWEKVAICETGGQWDHHTHNGFYGGLDITLTDWVLYGGLQYADRPDHATRAAQIIVAEKILATLGPDAWRDCEIGTGLLDDETPAADGSSADDGDGDHGRSGSSGKSGKDAGEDQGSTGDQDASSDGGTATDPADTSTDPADSSSSPESTDTSGATGTSGGTGTTTPTDPATTAPTDPADSPDPADTSAPPSADGTGTPATPTDPATGGGRHARPYSPTDEALAAADRATRTVTTAVTEGAPADSGKSYDSGESGDGADKSGKTDTASHKTPSTYTVGSGDSLSGIAAAQDVPGGWQHLYDANQQLIGDDPNLIKPGQILELG
jgi:LysM repeat protein